MSNLATKRLSAIPAEAFCADALPHLDAVYTDAFCLTGSREEAADLVLEAYVRAFQGYERFRRRRAQDTRAWLYENLHAVFCEAVLARSACPQTLIGERP